MNLIYNSIPIENISLEINRLLEKGFLADLVKKAQEYNISVIKISAGLYQFGYGKSSVIISDTYQSYEDAGFLQSTLDRCFLSQFLIYNHFDTVKEQIIYSESEVATYKTSYPVTLCSVNKALGIKVHVEDDINLIAVAKQFLECDGKVFIYSGRDNYRIICIEGKLSHVITLMPSDKTLSASKENEGFYKDRMDSLARMIYEKMPIQFMYIDFQINDSKELTIVDFGSAFNLLISSEKRASYLKEHAFSKMDGSLKADLASGENILSEKEVEIFQEILLNYLKYKLADRIPIFAITGTNGKTTTSRLLYNMLTLLGYNTGLTCTGGIFIGDKKIEAGDTTGFLSARKVLQNKMSEAAVFETARGGIIRNGLGYEKINGAIITSLSEDHIGLDSIYTLEDLASVKSVILEEVQNDGKWVLRAQKQIIQSAKKSFENIIEKHECNKLKYCNQSFSKKACLFDIDKNPLIEDHLREMGEAFYVEDQYIIQCKDNKISKLINVKDIPFTHNGMSEANILNVMATLAVLSVLNIKMNILLKALITIPSDDLHNPGRQNIFSFNDIQIILDYGHNAEAYKQVYSLVKAMNAQHVTSIISAPGDRLDQYIENLGYLAGKFSDNIILREHKNQRGSPPGRVSGLMKKGALTASLEEKSICYINDAMEALTFAIKRAVKGEIIVLFTEEPEIMIEKVNYMISQQ